VADWNPDWGQSGSLTDFSVPGGVIKFMNLNTYQGIAISSPDGGPGEPGVLDVTGKATLHISYWTPNGTDLQLFPIDAADHEVAIDSGTLVQNAWTDLDFPITSPLVDLTTIRQLKFQGPIAEAIYLDNIYFH
jgi:hypothetical protein